MMQHSMAWWLACAAAAMALPAAGQGSAALWQIGKPGGGTTQFALGPGGYAKYRDAFPADVFYVVGQSTPEKDWPYVQPGPNDTWAGNRSHPFTICFGLKQAPAAGECILEVRLADTQGGGPPRLNVAVNETKLPTRALPAGEGDESIFGNPAKGRRTTVRLPFPAATLRVGTNVVTLTTEAGSWLLYDSVTLTAPAGLELTAPSGARLGALTVDPALFGTDAAPKQRLSGGVVAFGQAHSATMKLDGEEVARFELKPGVNAITALVPATRAARQATVTFAVEGQPAVSRQIELKPVRRWTIYILPHSHNDIGYTDLQTAIEKKQMANIEKGIQIARDTQNNPPGSRYHWNVEVLWASESFMRQSPEKEKEFLDAVKAGWVGLDALYLNELTGLCRPEELIRLTRFATMLRQRTGVPLDSAMISDVPGLSWGVVTALNQAGVRYISDGVNPSDRIGSALAAWEDKPFYWVGPDGKNKVLVWTPHRGYALSHMWGHLTNPQTPERFFGILDELERKDYPYDIVQMRWSGFGDNAVPDDELPAFVKQWNEEHLSPKMVIARTSEAFHALEERYGDKLPTFRGDFTPYWEDGAGSSAAETALNRDSAERLVQMEALWSMRAPTPFPALDDYAAWRNVLFYSEHTWGAYNSVSEPDKDFVKDQWRIKQAFALDADKQSRALLKDSLASQATAVFGAVDVYNTSSWARTDVVTVPRDQSRRGDVVKDDKGAVVPSQRLSTGELAFLASDVQPFSSRRYTIGEGAAATKAGATASGTELSNGLVTVDLNPETGAVRSLRTHAGVELVDGKTGYGLNEYLYLPGGDLKGLQRNGKPRITVKEAGPLVASLLVESDAPGCNRMSREVRLYAGQPRVDFVNLLDKKAIREVEGGHMGFPFLVPNGQVRLDVQYGVVRPNVDQIPGACKNWFSVTRWADVSNAATGVTWATVDAPLVEVGGITANLPRSQPDPWKPWIQKLEPGQALYSWIFNNHWHTNYRADQQGPLTYRYSVLPHGPYDALAAARFGTERSQPLIVAPAAGDPVKPRLTLSSPDVMVTDFKPSDDGRAWIVRLFGAAGKTRKVSLRWSSPEPSALYLSDTGEQPGVPVKGAVEVPAWGLVTVRAER